MPINLTSVQIQEIVDYINNYRTIHQAPPLTWNNMISTFSQNWSDYLLANNLFKHSGNLLYGENLAYFKGYGTDIMTLLKLSVDNWYNEIIYYNFNAPGFSSSTGHFTCLVWKSSLQFGMGCSVDPITQISYISMNTSPPGNYIGLFQQNVLPAITPTPTPVPTPTPTPVPVPTPTPTPVPVPTPTPTPTPVPKSTIDLKTRTYVITALNSIINEVANNANITKVIIDLKNLKYYIKNV